MDSPTSLKYLNSFVNFEKNLSQLVPANLQLKRVEYLLKLLGRPQDHLKFIHVAGSKGKGSTCAFIAHILKSAGYRVGLYTSPHFYCLNERIRILQKSASKAGSQTLFSDAITDTQLARLITEIKPALEKARTTQWGTLTYFEVLTAAAIYFFAQQKVEFVIMETGLGGRLDATNVVDSLVAAITPISLEHTQILGKTLDKIAAEKAAIIKTEGRPVVIAPQTEKAASVIRQRIRKIGAQGYFIGRDITFSKRKVSGQRQSFVVKGLLAQYNLKTQLLGQHQVMNAATAVGVVESLGAFDIKISKNAVARGIWETFWPGRLEIIQRRPTIILDGAHNPDSCLRLVESLRELFPGKKFVFIVGTSADKDQKGVLQSLRSSASRIIVTKAHHPRAHDFRANELRKFLPKTEWVHTKDIKAALTQARKDSTINDVIVVTGSIFLVAQARRILSE